MNEKIIQVAKGIERAGGRMFIVGGAVRDKIMGRKPEDIDFAIGGITEERAKQIVEKCGGKDVKDVISNAPVFMATFGEESFEFAMFRIEIAGEPGDKSDFTFISNPSVTMIQDQMRRDFTIGSIMDDVLSGERFDPFGGERDIRNRIIRHISPMFSQSQERGIRAASQSARLDFDVASETIEIIRDMKPNFHKIHREQLWRHIEKMANKAIKPSRFVDVLQETGWNEFFGIKATVFEMDQEVPEGCSKVSWVISRMIIGMAEDEREKFFETICIPNVERREAIEFEKWDGKKPEAFVQGRDIIGFVKPGPQVGILLEAAFQAQIDGVIKNKEEGVQFIKDQISK